MAEMTQQGGRWLRWGGIAVAAIAAFAVVAFLLLGFTRLGTSLVLRLAAPLLETKDQTITIAGAGPLLNGHLRVERITVSDAKGVYAEIDGLAADWSPLELLALKARINTLTASRIRLERLPESSSNSSGSSSFSLPVEVNLRQMSLPKISLGPALSGREETLSAQASAALTRAGVRGAATIRDLGNTEASATASIDYDANAQTLAVDAKAEEPKGGVIAGLLGLPDRPGLGFSVKGSGALSNWQGRAEASVEGVPVVNLDTTVRRSATGPVDLALKGGGAFDAILPPVLEPLFKGRTDIDLALAYDPSGMLSVSRGTIATGTLAAELGGTLSAKGANDFHATISPVGDSAVFSLPAGPQTIGLDLRSLKATVTGSAEKAAIDAQLDLKSLNTAQGTLRDIVLIARSDAFNLQAQAGRIDTKLTVGGRELQSEALARLVQAPLSLTAPVTVAAEAVSADFQLEGASLGGKGKVALDRSSGSVDASVQMFAAPSALPDALSAKLLSWNLPSRSVK